MNKIWVLSRTTLRELLREKMFLVVVVMSAGLFALSLLLGALSLAEQKKILTDFGFLAIQVSMLGVSLFSGSYLVAKEIEKQTCLLILARPVSRDQFLMGKIGGVLLLNTLLALALGVFLGFLLKLWNQPQLILSFIKICLSLWFESAVILCLVICLSLVVRPVLALSSGFMIFISGHWLDDFVYFAEKSKDQLFMYFAKFAGWVTPNFYKMNWKSYYFLEKGIPNEGFIWMLIHTLGWIILLVIVANFLFRRKDIV